MKKNRHARQGSPGSTPDRVRTDTGPEMPAESSTMSQGENGTGLVLPAYLLIVCLLSLCIYGWSYTRPSSLFWDENYHITSAQKYIDGVFFMGDHPPLGKELIALGEFMLHPNKKVDTSPFLTVEKAQEVPAGYSFLGMRFVPAFLAVLGGVVFFFLLLALLENEHLAFLFSGLYLFENAFVVHGRGAMLDSIQMFFVLASIFCFVLMIKQEKKGVGSYFVLGMLLGASTAVKLNALLFIFLPLALFVLEFLRKNRSIGFYLRSSCAGVVGFLLVFLGSYVVHIYLTPHVMQERYYEASYDYRQILDNGETKLLSKLPLQLKEHLEFIPKYQKGVPTYDASKPGENGSLPYTWPFMNKTINYRWEKDGDKVRYLYLVGNPLLWLIGLCAVIAGTLLVLSRLVVRKPVGNTATFLMIVLFTALYWFYMAVMMRLERVMYLYHYFIPLILSYLLAALLTLYFFEKRILAGDKKLYAVTSIVMALVVACFLFYSPFTYYQPLSVEQFELRNWLPWWKMEAIR